MNELREAAKGVLYSLNRYINEVPLGNQPHMAAEEACINVEALRKALETEQEPVSIITQLWTIIDDIDTYSDMAKADDKLYRSLVERRQKDRWKTGVTTDGYTLKFNTSPPLKEITDDVNSILMNLSKEGYAPQLVYDDNGRWAVAMDSFGAVGSAPSNIIDDGLIWCASPIEAARAIIAAMRGEV